MNARLTRYLHARRLPYTSGLRHGMAKSKHSQHDLEDSTVRALVLAGLILGALLVIVQGAMWLSDYSRPVVFQMATTLGAAK